MITRPLPQDPRQDTLNQGRHSALTLLRPGRRPEGGETPRPAQALWKASRGLGPAPETQGHCGELRAAARHREEPGRRERQQEQPVRA